MQNMVRILSGKRGYLKKALEIQILERRGPSPPHYHRNSPCILFKYDFDVPEFSRGLNVMKNALKYKIWLKKKINPTISQIFISK